MTKSGCGGYAPKTESEKTNEDYIFHASIARSMVQDAEKKAYEKLLNSLNKRLLIEVFDRIRQSSKVGKGETNLSDLNDEGNPYGEENVEGGKNLLSDEVKSKLYVVLEKYNFTHYMNDAKVVFVKWAL